MDLIKQRIGSMHWSAVASLVLAACATVSPLDYPQEHPANPAAPVAAAVPASSTLAAYKSFSGGAVLGTEATPSTGQSAEPQPQQPSQEGAHEHHH